MALKRKAVAKNAGELFKAAKKQRKEVEKQALEDEQEQEQVEEENEEEEEPEVEEEKSAAQLEQEVVTARRKELKSMSVGDVKELMASHNLETGNKADMIEALLAREAKMRAEQRAHEAVVRQTVSDKKDDLENLSAPELKGLCEAIGVKGVLTKQARVETLLKQWLAEGGVDKALAKKARDAREEQLAAMDKSALKKICDKMGVDALVMDVMVERVIKRESEQGRFDRPKFEEDMFDEDDQSKVQARKSKDMIGALLADEASKKKERESKKLEEEEAASKLKELKAKSIDELKKMLTKKGREPVGKKDDLVEALVAIDVQEKLVNAKRTKLRALDLDDLKQRVSAKGLSLGKKDAMVEAILAHEAKIKDQVLAYEAKIDESLEKVKEELESKTAAELKEMCAAKNLKLGVGKPDRVQTLVQDARASGDMEKVVAVAAKKARKDELLSMDKAAVLKVCSDLDIDPFVKEIMIERVLCFEDENGGAKVTNDCSSAKGARKSKK
eukprot:TRINITY_DN37809_c0_g1_i1.p1 TRINITY_DN37809_c0_g1~~TRINITY_DN37809_c0_g1_i1.p1  ORF type:complete len:502 (-),score=183.32 TRINITY_DN37809_c0_g1_i1:216-1721(-)